MIWHSWMPTPLWGLPGAELLCTSAKGTTCNTRVGNPKNSSSSSGVCVFVEDLRASPCRLCVHVCVWSAVLEAPAREQ